MKYNKFNRKYENFKEKFDKFEKKYYLEIQDYKEFKKENYQGIDNFSTLLKRICKFLAAFIIVFCFVTYIAGAIVFLLFTVFR